MDAATLADLVDSPESEFLEFKRQWYDFEKQTGKGEFVKDVLAMANSLVENQQGHIVVGIDDPSRGARVVGAEPHPPPERLAQILESFTNPTPRLEVLTRSLGDLSVGILRIAWDRYQPHYATRDIAPVLDSNRVYIRRGPTIGHLTPPELENVIRAKDSRLRGHFDEIPLRVGFVEGVGLYDSRVAVRIVNLTDEPLEGVSAVVDLTLNHPAARSFRRRGLWNGGQLAGGESREAAFHVYEGDFYDASGRRVDRAMTWSQWVDLRLEVVYRDREGFFRRIVEHLSLGR